MSGAAVARLLDCSKDWISVTPKGKLLVRAMAMVFDRYLREDRARRLSLLGRVAVASPKQVAEWTHVQGAVHVTGNEGRTVSQLTHLTQRVCQLLNVVGPPTDMPWIGYVCDDHDRHGFHGGNLNRGGEERQLG